MSQRTQLSEFLRTRRARLRPQDVGIEDAGRRRRVPGLRREELARLAGVSSDYYVRLEQGRGNVHPSPSVLDALSRALRLSGAERSHLHRLARPDEVQTGPPEQAVRPEVQQMLDGMGQMPALVLGRRMDVLAWNKMAARLHVDFGALPPRMRNMARLVFLDPGSPQLFPDFEQVAEDTAAFLRLDWGVGPDDSALHELVDELLAASEIFCWCWARHHVREKAHGVKRYDHPTVGLLELRYETLKLAGDDQQYLVGYSAAAGSSSQAALERLYLAD